MEAKREKFYVGFGPSNEAWRIRPADLAAAINNGIDLVPNRPGGHYYESVGVPDTVYADVPIWPRSFDQASDAFDGSAERAQELAAALNENLDRMAEHDRQASAAALERVHVERGRWRRQICDSCEFWRTASESLSAPNCSPGCYYDPVRQNSQLAFNENHVSETPACSKWKPRR